MMRDTARHLKKNLEVAGPPLTLNRPILNPYVLHPAGLHLAEEGEKRLRWYEEFSPHAGPTMPEPKDISTCLWDFVRLDGKPDDCYLRFAETWGILGIFPVLEECPVEEFTQRVWTIRAAYDFDQIQAETLAGTQFPLISTVGETAFWHSESILLWRRLAAHFKAILLCAAALYESEKPGGDKSEGPGTDVWKSILDVDALTLKKSLLCWDRPLDRKPFSADFFLPDNCLPENAPRERRWLALLGVAERWTSQVSVSFKMQRTEDRQVGVTLDISRMPRCWTAEMYEQCKDQDWQAKDFRHEMTYWGVQNPQYLPMRSSILLNILVVQLVTALASGVHRCAICGETFEGRKPRYDKAALCGKQECRSAQAVNRVNRSRRRKQNAPAG